MAGAPALRMQRARARAVRLGARRPAATGVGARHRSLRQRRLSSSDPAVDRTPASDASPTHRGDRAGQPSGQHAVSDGDPLRLVGDARGVASRRVACSCRRHHLERSRLDARLGEPARNRSSPAVSRIGARVSARAGHASPDSATPCANSRRRTSSWRRSARSCVARRTRSISRSTRTSSVRMSFAPTGTRAACCERHARTLIDAMSGRIVGSDITGDVSAHRYRTPWKRWLSRVDGQGEPTAAELESWRPGQRIARRASGRCDLEGPARARRARRAASPTDDVKLVDAALLEAVPERQREHRLGA